MNDGWSLLGKREEQGLGLHVSVDNNGELGLGLGVLISKSKMNKEDRSSMPKMGEEEKKGGLGKRKLKLFEVKDDSDDDEPIGSLFKFKKPRNRKKIKPYLDGGQVEVRVEKPMVEVRVEKLRVEDVDSGEMEDTLASFRKKLKAPKIVRDGGLKGKGFVLNGAGPSDKSSMGSLIDGVLVGKSHSNPVEESPSHSGDGLDLVSEEHIKGHQKGKGRRKKIRNSTFVHEEKEEITAFSESSNHSSDDNMKDSLSAFVRKAHSSLVRKARSSSLRKKADGTQASDGISKYLLSGLVRRTSKGNDASNELSNDDEGTQASDGISKDRLHGLVRRTPKGNDASNELSNDDEGTQASDGISKDQLSGLVRRTTKVNDASNELSNDNSCIVVENPGSVVLKVTEKLAGSADMVNISSDGVSKAQPSTEVQNSCSMLSREITMPSFDGDRLNGPCEETEKENTIECEDCLNQVSEKSSKELPARIQTEENSECDDVKQPSQCDDGQMGEVCISVEEFNKFSDDSYASHTMKEEETCYNDGLNQPACVALEDSTSLTIQKSCLASATSQIEETPRSDDGLHKLSEGNLSVLPSDVVNTSDFSPTVNHKEELPHADVVLNQFYLGPSMDSATLIENSYSACLTDQPSDYVSKGPSCVQDSSIKKDKATGSETKLMDLKETNPEDSGRAFDPNKNDTLLEMPRPARTKKKRIHGDMAYEGDVDWEILMNKQGLFENNLVVDGNRLTKTNDKSVCISNMLAEVDNGGAAAVAAGLKACAVGPVEKIKFKEVLRRRGGLQEYLECRNLILGLWSKEVCRILPLGDCGVAKVPSDDEPPRASLIRKIYAFLDRSGYINVGIASEKEKAKTYGIHHFKLSKENEPEDNCGTRVTDSEEEVAFILGQVKNENLTMEKNNLSSEVEKPEPTLDLEIKKCDKLLVPTTGLESSKLIGSGEYEVGNMIVGVPPGYEGCVPVPLDTKKIYVDETSSGCINHENGCKGTQVIDRVAELDPLSNDLSCKIVVGGPDDAIAPEHIKASNGDHQFIDSNGEVVMHVEGFGVKSSGKVPVKVDYPTQCDLEVRRRVIVIGAGPAGLTAARHLQRQGFSVSVLEGRNRIGGRVYTDHSSLSVPVDLGASIITGVEADVATERRPDPSSLVCAQLGLELTVLNSDCPLYDIVTGQKVPVDLDEALEAEYNSLLDDMIVLVAQNGEQAMRMSLEEGLEYALKKRRIVENRPGNKVLNDSNLKEEILSPLERRVMDWHFANLEYGCAALLNQVSLPYWNQDDVYGGFGGAHCMIKGGYGAVVESLSKGLDIHLNHVVTEITYSARDHQIDKWQNEVKVLTSNGSEFVGDAVLITVPLGCLKANTIKFYPVLPEWKQSSIQRLGFGVLNKVVLEFPNVFWDDTVDYFGATAEGTDRRGQCFMFWNVKKTVGAPVLIALVVGKAAIDGQNMSTCDHVTHALMVLRTLFGEASVPDPVASIVTNWGDDPFSRGAYSYVSVGASGEDYDILGRPVENCLFFAGEATCKEHPDTVGGAMMSGLREAVRIIDILSTGIDCTAEVEAMESKQRQSDSERNEVRDMVTRLDAVEFSNVLGKSTLDGTQSLLTKEALLRDMFSNAKTSAGRLHLAKELLRLPVEVLKSFAGTKGGLNTLNSWILDSMGKDGTQLLRHCVRLLVLVSSDLLAVRLSGIGRTVKEKVCVHTSRDIRSVASQLVSMWIEVFRKEKAAIGGSKLLKLTTGSDASRFKPKDPSSGKPPLHTANDTSDSKGNLQVSSPAGTLSPSNLNNKKMESRPGKLETMTDTESEVNSSRSHCAQQSWGSKGEENIVMSKEEAAAFAAAEAARAAALAAAEAYASSEAGTLRELPKIPSFHKFARREQYAQMDDSELRRRNWLGGNFGRQDCLSDIDSRNIKVRNWSVDFSATCGNLDSSRMSGDNYTQPSYSNEVLNLREHSGESGAVESRVTKAWVDSAGSGGVKDYHAIELWQAQAADADAEFFHRALHLRDEEDSNNMPRLPLENAERPTEDCFASQVTENKVSVVSQPRGAEHIKQAVVDYVASLLMPLYKARKIDKEGYKSILKKSATKVMDHSTAEEKVMTISEFLDFKRKNKIRSFVDTLIERRMAMNPGVKT
ncbi:lysine-specific histone demethylase 1 homolog 3-like [Tasmannia lanceolata]|uniref:lysine-specific histone demethylase 1 homolog 3-like n=1 Tax=Tasmannia lanceolata TaxID=3420 RepID=UPI004064B388